MYRPRREVDWLAAMLFAAILSGCSVPRPGDGPREPAPAPRIPVSASDGQWELVTSTFIGAGRIPGVRRATLAFEDGRIAVFSGCNQGSASAYHVEGRLEVAALIATRRACPEPLGTFEARYFKLLQARPVYRMDGDTLMLLDGEQSARFRRLQQGATGSAGKP
ncbi:MAG TPA: META domain-containing protein [Burkholderiales bacterium]|nr:META domain-containing protein [Burkholderiales bacterium]